MNAIDELRRLLDECGIHWWAGDNERKTLWESNGLTWEYFNDENSDAWLGFLGTCEQDITPEQAIAATLGGGKLTAEQVRKAIFNGSAYASYDGAKYYADGIHMQAIADELNVMLGHRTCTVTRDFNCSNCGKQIGVVRNCEMYETCDGRQAWKSLDHEVCDVPNYCQNCGAEIIK